MINYELDKIKAIIFDVDGVLSLNTVSMNSEGDPVRTLNIKDGYAIQLACELRTKLADYDGRQKRRYTETICLSRSTRCVFKLCR